MYETITSLCYALNERIAQKLFSVLPEQGPIIVIMDKNGNCWSSDEDGLSGLKISRHLLREILARIDDGDEPVVTQSNAVGIAVAQLATERTDCGYVLIALPHSSAESAFINFDVIETLLDQISLVAELVEKNTLLHELHLKNYNLYSNGGVPSN